MAREQLVQFNFDSQVVPLAVESARMDIARIVETYPFAVPLAFDLEVLKGNAPNDRLEASKYGPLFAVSASDINPNWEPGFNVISWNLRSPTQGIVYTPYDAERVNVVDGLPEVVRFDPERRRHALAERAWHIGRANSEEMGEYLYELEMAMREGKENDATVQYPVRTHRAFNIYKEGAIQIDGEEVVWGGNPNFSDFAYRKLFDRTKASRNRILQRGIMTRIGKEIRATTHLGPMYDASGSVDAIVTAAITHRLGVLPRNGIYADFERQFALAREVMRKIDSMEAPNHRYGTYLKEKWKKNVAVAVGVENPDEVVAQVEAFYKLGITAFKVFTISSNENIVETCRKLRERFGHSIEIFAGQIADKDEALQLIADDIEVDGFSLGHGGGRQCTSGIGGMAISTIQLLDSLRSDPRFQHVTILVEGGVGEHPGIALLMGADGIFYYQRFTGAVIEGVNGDLLNRQLLDWMLGNYYRGEASLVSSQIEACLSAALKMKHFDPSGRTKQTEGKWGFTEFHRKSSSMTYNIYMHERLIAKMLADIGVWSIGDLRRRLGDPVFEILTRPTFESNAITKAYRQSR